jgi:acyl dehydratase
VTVPIYLDDLTVGQVFRGGPLTVTAEDIKAFAREWDPQPFHMDEDAARAHPIFQGLAASGWHTGALMMRMTVQAAGALGWGVVGGGGELQWVRPVRPDDVLRLETEVLEVTPSRSRADRGSALMRNRVLNQLDEEVQVFTVRILVPRRPAREDGA